MQNCDSPTILPANSTAILEGLSSTHLQSNQPLVFKTTLLLPSCTAPAEFVPILIPTVPTWKNNSNLDETKHFLATKDQKTGLLVFSFLRIKRQHLWGFFYLVVGRFFVFWSELSDNICCSELEPLQPQKPICGSYFSRIIFFSKKSQAFDKELRSHINFWGGFHFLHLLTYSDQD